MLDAPTPVQVVARTRETHDTWTLALERPTAAFAPGQFAMLYAFGAGEVPISVSSIDDGRLRHTIRAVGAVTAALCRAEPGDVLGLRGPFGTAWPVDQARGHDVVIVAGGIGLAPLRPVIHELLAHRDRYDAISVLYGARTPEDLLYVGELEHWRGRFDVDVAVTVDAAGTDWRGRVGLVTRLIARAEFTPNRTLAMLCGPEVMMRFTAEALRDCGVDDDAIWLSLERNMKCATRHCGHCQLGPLFVCQDGPVVRRAAVAPLLAVEGL